MIDDKFLNILRCIKCRGSLNKKKSLLVCDNCDYRYSIIHGIPSLIEGNGGVDVQITKDKWEQIYKDEHEKLDLEGERQLLSHVKFISSFREVFKRGICLDLGCGFSRTVPFLVKMGVSFLGLDISIEALKRSKNLLEKENLKGYFVQANFLNIPIKDSSIDSVFWGLALEYVQDTERAVSEVYRVLKPGGVLLATFPPLSISNITYGQLRGDIPDLPIIKSIIRWLHIDIFKGKYMPYGYGQSLSVKFVERVFSEAGFNVKKIGYFDTYYPLTFIPKILKPLARKVLRFRFFWPVAYIEAIKQT